MDYHRENADVVSKIVKRWRKTKFLSDMDQRRLTCALQNMRMSCNSTYLLNQDTDHGVKADELAALFDDLFLEPDTKAVVFSQWTRTHDIVIRRLEARGLGYVSFHGACHRRNGRRWSSGFGLIPPAACSCQPMRAAPASICNMLDLQLAVPWPMRYARMRCSRIAGFHAGPCHQGQACCRLSGAAASVDRNTRQADQTETARPAPAVSPMARRHGS